MTRRVLIVPEWYPWPERPGLGVWAREQALAVAGGNEVAVLAAQRVGSSALGGYEIAEAQEDGLLVARVRYRAAAAAPKGDFAIRLRGLYAAARGLRRRGFQPAVVHAHVFSAGFPALFLARRLRAPLVVSEHYSGIPLGRLSRWDRAIARFTFERAALVCPASDELARHVGALAPRARLRPVPNPVDTDVFQPARETGADGGGPVRAVVVGALKAGKGHPELLEALAQLDRDGGALEVDLVGDGPDRHALEGQARRLGVERLVRFHGRLPKDEVAEQMRRADFLILPSLWENAPVAAVEALACGLPVVGSRVGGIPEIVPEDSGMLVPPGDVHALAGAIRAMSDRYGDFDSAQLAQRAHERFGFEAVARQWALAYDEAVTIQRR